MRQSSIVWVPIVVSLIGVAGCSPCTRNMDPAKFKELVNHYDDGFKLQLAEANKEIGKDIVRCEPIASDVIPRKVTFHGTHREIGRWLGLVAKRFFGEANYVELRNFLKR